MGKKNFKYLIAGHLIGIILLGTLIFFIAAKDRAVLGLVIIVLFVSLIVQSSIYKKKPGFFNDKVESHPDQPEQL